MQIGKHLGKRRETLFGKHRKHPAKWIRTQPTCARRDRRSATARVRPRCAACKDTSIGGRPAPLRLRWGDRRAARALREFRMSVPGGRRVPGVPVVDVVGVVGYENRGKNGQGVQNASRDLVAGTPAGTRVYTRVNTPSALVLLPFMRAMESAATTAVGRAACIARFAGVADGRLVRGRERDGDKCASADVTCYYCICCRCCRCCRMRKPRTKWTGKSIHKSGCSCGCTFGCSWSVFFGLNQDVETVTDATLYRPMLPNVSVHPVHPVQSGLIGLTGPDAKTANKTDKKINSQVWMQLRMHFRMQLECVFWPQSRCGESTPDCASKV